MFTINLFAVNENILKIIDYSLSSILMLAFLVFMLIHIRKKSVIVTYLILFVLHLSSLFLKLQSLANVTTLTLIIFSAAVILINASEFRNSLSNFSSKFKFKLYPSKKDRRKFDKNDVVRIMDQTIRDFSKTKTGAIMIFQKSQELDDGINDKGVSINAPISMEMLQTIFYKGTRLHDGAVIIKDDKIVSAAVMLVATTRPLNGKYGTRHRAAIGISERSDAVVVCVSEETGRVSLAYKGNLEPISLDRFKEEFSDLLNRA